MEDNRNHFERSQAMIKLVNGKPETGDELVSRFAAYDVRFRAEALDALDVELKSEDMNLTDRVNALARRRRLGDVHELLRKAGR